jgi:hypothetical protein
MNLVSWNGQVRLIDPNPEFGGPGQEGLFGRLPVLSFVHADPDQVNATFILAIEAADQDLRPGAHHDGNPMKLLMAGVKHMAGHVTGMAQNLSNAAVRSFATMAGDRPSIM